MQQIRVAKGTRPRAVMLLREKRRPSHLVFITHFMLIAKHILVKHKNIDDLKEEQVIMSR